MEAQSEEAARSAAAASNESPAASTGRGDKRLRAPGLEDDAQWDTRRSHIGAINALQAICEETPEIEDTHLGVAGEDETLRKRQAHIERIARGGKSIVRVVSRSSVATRASTGRWVDALDKSRWTTRGFEQSLGGTENHVANTPALTHLKALLVHAEVRGHVVALGDCSGAFYQAPLKEERIFLETPPEAQVPPESVWEVLYAFPGLKGAPKAWEKQSAQVMEKLGMTRGRYDGCMFQRRSDQSKAARHADDFVVTVPREEIDKLVDEMEQKLQLSDVVRLYEDGDEGTFLSMGIRQIPGGYALKGRTSLVEDVLWVCRSPIRRVCRRPRPRTSMRATTSRSELWSIARIVNAWASYCSWRHIVQTFNMVLES